MAPAGSVRRLFLLVLAFGLTVLGLALFARPRWRTRPDPDTPHAAATVDDPRLTFATLFRNVRPDVHHVGDAACASCHRRIATAYARHPMGRSLAPVAADAGLPGPPTAFAAAGLYYAVLRRDGLVFHRESALDRQGKELARREAPVHHAIGSGTRGISYLIEQDGYLFQSPISWYGDRRLWDLSPGYRQRSSHFDRAVAASCLFCHANAVRAVPHLLNRFETPVFRAGAIGCERCHGPGELHVAARREGGFAGGIDHTIVNPRHLPPALREDVCRQCHLQGMARIVRRGRDTFDYRPGLPLALFWAVFTAHPALGGERQAVGQVEQLAESHCARASRGKMSCASCHDPHELPAPAAKAAFYRDRCLTCHADRGCTLPLAERRARGDDCAACHMPRLPVNIPHVAATDHRILRRPEATAPAAPPGPLPSGASPLLPFEPDPGPDGGRDLALALLDLADRVPPGPFRRHLGGLALPLLRQAAARHPDDLPAREGKGRALRLQDRLPEALATHEAILTEVPGRELALAEAGTVAGKLERPAVAATHWRQAVAVNPHRWHYHHHLALALADLGHTGEALATCAAARRLNPVAPEVRLLEVTCLLRSGRTDDARAAFAELMALNPPGRDALRRWFEAAVGRP